MLAWTRYPQVDGIEQRHELRGNGASTIECRKRHRVHELPLMVMVSRGKIAGLDAFPQAGVGSALPLGHAPGGRQLPDGGVIRRRGDIRVIVGTGEAA